MQRQLTKKVWAKLDRETRLKLQIWSATRGFISRLAEMSRRRILPNRFAEPLSYSEYTLIGSSSKCLNSAAPVSTKQLVAIARPASTQVIA